MNQSGRHNQLQRQPGQDRQARTSGARTNPKGPDKARTRTPGTRRVKPRVRPATPQISGARAAKISASGCKTVKAGSKELLRLRIAPLSDRTTALNISSIARPSRGRQPLLLSWCPRAFPAPTWSRLVPRHSERKKKPAWSNTQRHTTTPAYSSTGPPAQAGLPFS
jgi:hypothetical protein